MGTRSTYRIIEQYKNEDSSIENNELVLVYVQYDGYPTGHPITTAEWLSTGVVVNGFGLNQDKLIFNGAGCLAAQFIDKMKDGVGGTYINSLSSRGECGEDYLSISLSRMIERLNMFVMTTTEKKLNCSEVLQVSS